MSGDATAWRMRGWDDGELIARWSREGFISMSSDEAGVPISELSEIELRRVLKTAHPDRKARAIDNWVGYWRAFVKDLAIGDIVVLALPRKSNRDVLHAAITEVAGDYEYVGSEESFARHRRAVRWHATIPRSDLDPYGLVSAVNTPATIARFKSATAVRDLSTFFRGA